MGTAPEYLLQPTTGQAQGAVVAGVHRYLLWRIWDERLPRLLWMLLNPSTAGGNTDDPTLRKCHTFSSTWGYGGLEVVNLFALRSPYPSGLKSASDPIGAENDRFIVAAANRSSSVVVAWGNHGAFRERGRAVLDLLSCSTSRTVLCLGVTKHNHPCHPLYVASSTLLVRYPPHVACHTETAGAL
jgi:hypothetical protein